MDTTDLRNLALLDADARRILKGAMLKVDHARLGFQVSAFVRLRAKAAHQRLLEGTARAMPQVIEMHSVSGDDCMVVRVVGRSTEELAGIPRRLTVLAESSPSMVLETLIPLRNPLPMQEAAPKRPRGSARAHHK